MCEALRTLSYQAPALNDLWRKSSNNRKLTNNRCSPHTFECTTKSFLYPSRDVAIFLCHTSVALQQRYALEDEALSFHSLWFHGADFIPNNSLLRQKFLSPSLGTYFETQALLSLPPSQSIDFHLQSVNRSRKGSALLGVRQVQRHRWWAHWQDAWGQSVPRRWQEGYPLCMESSAGARKVWQYFCATWLPAC